MRVVELFIRMGFVTENQREFRHEINRHEAPSSKEIRRWVRMWCEEGSVVCKKLSGRPSSVRTT